MSRSARLQRVQLTGRGHNFTHVFRVTARPSAAIESSLLTLARPDMVDSQFISIGILIKPGFLGTIFAAALITLSATANATEWVRCDSCSPGQAGSMVLGGHAPFEKVVVNPAQRWALKFEVRSEGSGPGCSPERRPGGKAVTNGTKGFGGVGGGGNCTYQNVAYEVPLTTEEAGFKDALAEYYAETGGTMKTGIQIDYSALNLPHCPPSDCVWINRTAYDVMRTFVVQRDVNQAVRDMLNFVSAFGRILDYVAGALNIVLLGGNMDLAVTVTFADGSTVTILFSESVPAGEITQSRDGAGMPIMNSGNMSGFNGSWTYPYGSGNNVFLDHAACLGVPIANNCYSPTRAVTCSWNVSGTSGALQCRNGC